ncbi:MAG TPA: hypothetical protein VE090_02755 [Methylomirabilota bacterium]|nr:hypothetical protein [Methylomirabilota bacterium]
MTEIINKITSYNLFNYLVPGVLFAAFVDYFTIYPLIQDNLIIGAFVYYFLGLVVSRFGSLVIEPVLKKISFLKFAPYTEYISASKIDPKIELFSEENNMYRTFISLFVLLILLKTYEIIEFKLAILKDWNPYILVGVLLIMFLYSYKKQTKYITKRIKENQS